MHQTIYLLSALASLALAQNQTFEFFFPSGAEGVDPVVSIKSVNPPTTVVAISCPTASPGFDETECGWGPGLEYTVISSTIYKGTISEPGVTMTFSCDDNIKKEEVTCGVSVGGSAAEMAYTSNVVWAKTDVARINATITAGAEKLAAQTGIQSTPIATSTTSSTAAAGSQASNTKASSTSGLVESTGAAYKFGVEGSALFALAGAAALNAW
ncbi:hypothetical protein B0J11DRAFT_446042 [Dendryphion nanum]|uniref:GPI anchored cell wall protein n=1 Tax=Dendryphion nanum TaxID=256645 RepID=A0A9P9D6C2_9PLEO|nr:hypothetical protein B0J11DRAFT_446042 [Dendryphion nanum]